MNNKSYLLITLICLQMAESFCSESESDKKEYAKIPLKEETNRGWFYHNKWDHIAFNKPNNTNDEIETTKEKIKTTKEKFASVGGEVKLPENIYTDGTRHLIFVYEDGQCPYKEGDKGYTKNPKGNSATVSFPNAKFYDEVGKEIPLHDLGISSGTQTPHFLQCKEGGMEDHIRIPEKDTKKIGIITVNNRKEISGISKILIVSAVCYIAYRAYGIAYAARSWWNGNSHDKPQSK